jgi:2-polyprenyl-3-methyl-5-hydroxy-6-metoxy-1,4-benzoquinol methylase
MRVPLPQDHWELIYSNQSHADLSWYQSVPKISLELINKFASNKENKIIDIGCGESFLVDSLIDQGYKNLTLLDISSKALQNVQQRLKDTVPVPLNIIGDVLSVELESNKYDIWHDRACFHFLTNEVDIQKYLEKTLHALSDKGKVILSTFATDGPEKCSNLPVHRHDQESIEKIFGKHFLIDLFLRENHITPKGKLQSFIFFVMIRR